MRLGNKDGKSVKFESIIKVLKFFLADCNDNNLIREKELGSDWFSACERLFRSLIFVSENMINILSHVAAIFLHFADALSEQDVS